MIQRMESHRQGTFPACKCCGKEPKHYIATGRCSSDPVMSGTVGERHILECFCRGAVQRTRWHARLSDAVREWRDHFAVTALALKSRPRRAA